MRQCCCDLHSATSSMNMVNHMTLLGKHVLNGLHWKYLGKGNNLTVFNSYTTYQRHKFHTIRDMLKLTTNVVDCDMTHRKNSWKMLFLYRVYNLVPKS